MTLTPERRSQLSDDSDLFDASEILIDLIVYYDFEIEEVSDPLVMGGRLFEQTTARVCAARLDGLFISRDQLVQMVGREWVEAREQERSV